MRSPIYWHRCIYRNTSGRVHPGFENRYNIVAGLIEPGSSVLDLCCGDAHLFTHYLDRMGCGYVGVDLSLSMAPHKIRDRLIRGDALAEEFPVSDYVVIMESLYHFNARAEELLVRMQAAARREVIILEQVKNKITMLPRWLNRFLSDPGDGSGMFRFNRLQLEEIICRVEPAARIKPAISDYDLLILMPGRAVREE